MCWGHRSLQEPSCHHVHSQGANAARQASCHACCNAFSRQQGECWCWKYTRNIKIKKHVEHTATKTEYRSFTLPGRGKSSQATGSLGKTKSDECGPFLDSMKVEFLFIESIWVTEFRWTCPQCTSAAQTPHVTITDRRTYTDQHRAGTMYLLLRVDLKKTYIQWPNSIWSH